MKTRLTDKTLANLKPPTEGRFDVFDTLTPGFGVRVSAAGRKTFFVYYRVDGRQVRQSLGQYAPRPADSEGDDSEPLSPGARLRGVTLAEARAAARKAQAKAADRQDPRERPAEVLPDGAREAVTSVIDDFVRLYVEPRLKPATVRTYKPELNRIKRRWPRKRITEISRRDVLDLTEGFIAEGKPAQANLTHRLLSKLFNWCVERGVLESAPTAGLRPPGKVQPRDRVLTDAELRTLWEATGRVGYPWGTLARLLLVTAQRETEVIYMQHPLIEAGVWTMPDTKRGTPHAVVLPDLAQAVLEACPRFKGPYVLSTHAGEKPIGWISEAKRRIDRAAEDLHGEGWPRMEPWRFHDLRRTAASGMARLGVSPHVIEAVLNHRTGTITGIARVYNRYTYGAEAAEALARWARHLESLIGQAAPAERAETPVEA